MHAVLVIARALRARRRAGGVRFVGGRARFAGGRWLLGGRHVDGRDQIVAAARFERWRAFVFVVAAATAGTGTGEDEVVNQAGPGTGRCLVLCCFFFFVGVCECVCDAMMPRWTDRQTDRKGEIAGG